MLQHGHKRWGHSNKPRAPVALDRVKHAIRIKTLEQNDRNAETNACHKIRKPSGVHHRKRNHRDLILIEAEMSPTINSCSQRCLGMYDKSRDTGCSRGCQQHSRRMNVGYNWNRGGNIAQEICPRLHVSVYCCTASDETPFQWEDRAIDRTHLSVEIRMANIERRLQPLQQRRQLCSLRSVVQRDGDSPYSKAGISCNDQLGPVWHMQDNAIASSNATSGESTRKTFDIHRQPLVSPRVIASDEG